MENMENRLNDYARLVVKTGVNIEEKQILVVNSPVECAFFARKIADAAYNAGAREVVVCYSDEKLGRMRFEKGADEIFDEFPQWRQKMYIDYAQKGAAFISIAASDPEILKGIDVKRVARSQKAAGTALREYRERMMNNNNTWCVVSIPTLSWAKKVFPHDEDAAAVDKLWQAILQTVRVDGIDAVKNWDIHKAELKENKDWMNEQKFQYLKYSNSLGTELTVELPPTHIWYSGTEYTTYGRPFIANIPTEEVYTLPKRDGINGVVYSSKPLNYQGNLIENFNLRFEAGRVVGFHAEKGEEILKKLLETDEGACYLGEVALVPYDSPISKLNLLFYNTLFDENAACHLALGKAYPTCIENGENMTAEELLAAGVNDSMIHEDFMIGTADLKITGTTFAGKEVVVFENGNFAK